MTEFFEKTWFIWWAIAILAFLRWFHILSVNRGVEHEAEDAELEGQGTRGGGSRKLNSLPL